MQNIKIKSNIDKINANTRWTSPLDLLRWANSKFGKNITLASSLGPQSIVLTHMMKQLTEDPDIFLIDTYKLFPETYELLRRCERYFDVQYRILRPNCSEIEKYNKKHGSDAIYNSITLRKRCCEIRKLDPLKQALKGYSAWISGIRKNQNSTRQNINKIEWDNRFDLLKLNPLAEWTEGMIWEYIRIFDLPYNELHDKNYGSIGCQPCTRALKVGEKNLRAGRWWWEKNTASECGLHLMQQDEKRVELQLNLITPNSPTPDPITWCFNCQFSSNPHRVAI